MNQSTATTSDVSSIFRKVLLSVMVVWMTFLGIIPQLPEQQVQANEAENYCRGNNDVFGVHCEPKFNDLLASYLYTQSGSNTVDDAKISLSNLARYPVADENGSYGLYGDLNRPPRGSEPTVEGQKLSDYITTLSGYDYLVTESADSGWSLFSFLGSLLGDAADQMLMVMAVKVALFGAMLFDVFKGGIEWLTNVASTMNVFSLIGFTIEGYTDSEALSNLNIEDSAFGSDEVAASNPISRLLHAAMMGTGLSPEAIQVLIFGINMVIMIAFLVMLVVSLNAGSRKGPLGHIKKFSFRVLTIVLAIPFSIFIISLINDFAESAEEQVSAMSASPANDIIVDTLKWAVLGNLDLRMVNPSGRFDNAVELEDGRVVYPDFAPTRDNIAQLNLRLNAIDSQVGYTTSMGGSAELSDRQMLSNFSSTQTVSVVDYHNGLAGLNHRGRLPSITDAFYPTYPNAYYTPQTVSNVVLFNGVGSPTGDVVNGVGASPFPINAYFMLDNSQNFSSNFTTYMNSEFRDTDDNDRAYYNPSNITTTDEGARTDIDQFGAQTRFIQMGLNLVPPSAHSQLIPTLSNGPFNYALLDWSDPSTYIYGAHSVGDHVESTVNYANYIDAPSEMNKQRYNPVTGEPEFTEDEANMENVIRRNSVAIAAMNRFAGIGVNHQALSTQSVTFLLQSHIGEGNVLEYQGYNTVASREGEAKNTSAYGNSFLRYVIPTSGPGELSAKIGYLNLSYLTAGALMVLAFLYLIRAPILGAIAKQLKYAITGMSTGNFTHILTLLAFYAALRFSFMFAIVGAHLGLVISQAFFGLSDSFSEFLGNLSGAAGLEGDRGLLGSILAVVVTATGLSAVTAGIEILIYAAVVLIIVLAVTWPAITISQGGRSDKQSLLSIVIYTPYLIAEAFEVKMQKISAGVYGKSNDPVGTDGMSAKFGGGKDLRGLGTKVGKGATGVLGKGAAFAGGAVLTAAKLTPAGRGAAIAGSAAKLMGGKTGAVKAVGKLGGRNLSSKSTGLLRRLKSTSLHPTIRGAASRIENASNRLQQSNLTDAQRSEIESQHSNDLTTETGMYGYNPSQPLFDRHSNAELSTEERLLSGRNMSKDQFSSEEVSMFNDVQRNAYDALPDQQMSEDEFMRKETHNVEEAFNRDAFPDASERLRNGVNLVKSDFSSSERSNFTDEERAIYNNLPMSRKEQLENEKSRYQALDNEYSQFNQQFSTTSERLENGESLAKTDFTESEVNNMTDAERTKYDALPDERYIHPGVQPGTIAPFVAQEPTDKNVQRDSNLVSDTTRDSSDSSDSTKDSEKDSKESVTQLYDRDGNKVMFTPDGTPVRITSSGVPIPVMLVGGALPQMFNAQGEPVAERDIDRMNVITGEYDTHSPYTRQRTPDAFAEQTSVEDKGNFRDTHFTEDERSSITDNMRVEKDENGNNVHIIPIGALSGVGATSGVREDDNDNLQPLVDENGQPIEQQQVVTPEQQDAYSEQILEELRKKGYNTDGVTVAYDDKGNARISGLSERDTSAVTQREAFADNTSVDKANIRDANMAQSVSDSIRESMRVEKDENGNDVHVIPKESLDVLKEQQSTSETSDTTTSETSRMEQLLESLRMQGYDTNNATVKYDDEGNARVTGLVPLETSKESTPEQAANNAQIEQLLESLRNKGYDTSNAAVRYDENGNAHVTGLSRAERTPTAFGETTAQDKSNVRDGSMDADSIQRHNEAVYRSMTDEQRRETDEMLKKLESQGYDLSNAMFNVNDAGMVSIEGADAVVVIGDELAEAVKSLSGDDRESMGATTGDKQSTRETKDSTRETKDSKDSRESRQTTGERTQQFSSVESTSKGDKGNVQVDGSMGTASDAYMEKIERTIPSHKLNSLTAAERVVYDEAQGKYAKAERLHNRWEKQETQRDARVQERDDYVAILKSRGISNPESDQTVVLMTQDIERMNRKIANLKKRESSAIELGDTMMKPIHSGQTLRDKDAELTKNNMAYRGAKGTAKGVAAVGQTLAKNFMETKPMHISKERRDSDGNKRDNYGSSGFNDGRTKRQLDEIRDEVSRLKRNNASATSNVQNTTQSHVDQSTHNTYNTTNQTETKQQEDKRKTEKPRVDKSIIDDIMNNTNRKTGRESPFNDAQAQDYSTFKSEFGRDSGYVGGEDGKQSRRNIFDDDEKKSSTSDVNQNPNNRQGDGRGRESNDNA